MPVEASKKVPAEKAPVKVYSSSCRDTVGTIASIRLVAAEIYSFRSHAITLFSNDFKASYRGTAFGVIWNIILPLVPITVYLLLVSIRVFPSYDGMEPALFLAFNVMCWYFFTGILLRPIEVVKMKAATSMKTSLPLSVAISSSFAQLCFDAMVRLILVALLIVFFRDWPAPNVLGLLAVLLVSIVFCLASGLILSIFNMAYSDIQRVITILLQYGLFLSGVIFPMSSMGRLAVLEPWNPFAVFVGAARDYLFTGTYAYPEALACWGAGSVILFLVGMRFFYSMEQRVRGLT